MCIEIFISSFDLFFIMMLLIEVELPDPDDDDHHESEWTTTLRKRIWSLARDKVDMIILSKNSYADVKDFIVHNI